MNFLNGSCPLVYFSGSPGPSSSSCTDTLSLSSRSSESDTSLLSPRSRCNDDTFLMSPKRQRIDSLMSPRSQHADDRSLQAKEVIMHPNSVNGAYFWHLIVWCSLLTISLFYFIGKLVKRVLEQKPGGEKILKEYGVRAEMNDRTHRSLVNIVVAHMFEK